MMANAVPNAAGCPIACAVSLASRPNRDVVRTGIQFLKCIREPGREESTPALAHRSPREISTLPCHFHFLTSASFLVFHISTANPPAADPFNSMSSGELEYAIFFEPHAARGDQIAQDVRHEDIGVGAIVSQWRDSVANRDNQLAQRGIYLFSCTHRCLQNFFLVLLLSN